MKQHGVDIRNKVLSGAIWKFAERILAQAVSLIVSIYIARLLDPSDYGVVSIVTVFFAFANVLISGGLNTALIQKKDADDEDYNTVFSVSLLVALAIYAGLFFAAPWVANIYKQEILKSIIRVLGLSLPIYALKSIVCAYVSSSLQFRMFFFATLGGTLASAVVGISLAYRGYGAWALVAQQLTNTIIDTLILFIKTKLRLYFRISFNKLRSLVKYGSKILASSLLGVTFNQINPLFIGLKYSSADLSFYTKGRALPETLSSSMIYTISSVLFPVLAKYQEERERLLKYTRSYMQMASFIVFPVMLGFFAVSDNFVNVCLTDKWSPVVYYIRIVCLSDMFLVVAAGNCETIKAMGRSDIFLKIEIAKKTGYFITLALFLYWTDTPETLALSLLVCTAIQIIINSIPNIKLIGYTVKMQMADLIPNLMISVVMCAVVMLIDRLGMNAIVSLVIQIVAGVLIYILLAIITRNSTLRNMLNILKTKH